SLLRCVQPGPEDIVITWALIVIREGKFVGNKRRKDTVPADRKGKPRVSAEGAHVRTRRSRQVLVVGTADGRLPSPGRSPGRQDDGPAITKGDGRPVRLKRAADPQN